MRLDSFGLYVKTRLDEWGREFALHRDCEYLGYQSKTVLQMLFEHHGKLPGRVIGVKPLEVSQDALQIEFVVSDIAREQVSLACVLRAYYCGQGRRRFERWETANLLLTAAGQRAITQRHYLVLHDLAFAQVRGTLVGIVLAA